MHLDSLVIITLPLCICREITTFESYSQEVLSGQLKWGILHTERFWRETAKEMDTDDFFIVKRLIEVGLMADNSLINSDG